MTEAGNIQELERHVRELHLNPIQQKHVSIARGIKEAFTEFYFIHVLPVAGIAEMLAFKYGAKSDVCRVGGLVHDLSWLDDPYTHDVAGAEKAARLLKFKGFGDRFLFEAAAAVMTHRHKKYPPVSLEQKIIAAADALAHLKQPFLLWYRSLDEEYFKRHIGGLIRMLDDDFEKKICFEEEKEAVRIHYQLWKRWLESEIARQ